MSLDAAAQIRKARRPKFVYFARVGDYLKVGCSYNPQQRVKQIRHDGCMKPRDLDRHAPTELLRAVPAGRGVEGFDVEFHYIAVLADFHVMGEWFRATPEVLDWIAGLDPKLGPWEQQRPPVAASP